MALSLGWTEDRMMMNSLKPIAPVLGWLTEDRTHIAMAMEAVRDAQRQVNLAGVGKDQINASLREHAAPQMTPGYRAPSQFKIARRPRCVIVRLAALDLD